MINNPSLFEHTNDCDKTNSSLKYVKYRRFASLSIMTCGDNDLRGYANMGHTNKCYLPSSSMDACYIQMKNIRDEYLSNSNLHLLEVLYYLKKRYDIQNKFLTYTTYGTK